MGTFSKVHTFSIINSWNYLFLNGRNFYGDFARGPNFFFITQKNNEAIRYETFLQLTNMYYAHFVTASRN